MVVDLPLQRAVLLLQRRHLGVDPATFGGLAVDGERNHAAEQRDDAEPDALPGRAPAGGNSATDCRYLVRCVAGT